VRRGLAAGLLALALSAPLRAESTARATLVVDPLVSTVGDHLAATLTVELPTGVEVEPVTIGPHLGKFVVTGEAWSAPETRPDGTRLVRWTASLAAFETGSLELPPITVRLRAGTEAQELQTAPVKIEVQSVLAKEPQASPEIADLKPPASVAPDFRAIWVALALLGALVLGAGVVWWVHRRFAGRLAAVPVPEDPFHREPPHVWVYRELQQLLERRLAEQGRVDEFYAELGRIVKTYLSGRYRIDLLERTSEEVRDLLERSGAPPEATEHASGILADCDLVKFARRRPEPSSWRTVVETVYALVDATRAPDAGRGAA
jgi:hypothetical protein